MLGIEDTAETKTVIVCALESSLSSNAHSIFSSAENCRGKQREAEKGMGRTRVGGMVAL